MSKEYDVIIMGGGPSGFIAAIAAGRAGVRTLLVDKNGFLGGAPTSAALGPISPFHFGDEQVVKGIPQEFIDRMVEYGASTGHMKTLYEHGSGSYSCFYDRERYKWIAYEMVKEAGVDVLFHSFFNRTIVEGNRVTGINVVNKSGENILKAKIVVDATGDGDVAEKAGAEFTFGRMKDGKTQPATLMFEMGNVNTEKLYQFMLENPDEFEWKSDFVPVRKFSDKLSKKYFVAQGFNRFVREAINKEELYIGRDSILLLNSIHPGIIHFNSTRVVNIDATDGDGRTKAEIDGRRQVESIVKFMTKYVPGFENAFLSVTGNEIGVRETRHIIGNYVLTADDVTNGRKQEDVIARGYFPIDVHNMVGREGYGQSDDAGVWTDLKDSYDIPYRALIPTGVDGLVIAGRCISATSEAHGSFRTQGGVMAIGQAAGSAAALSVLNNVHPRDLDVEKLQEYLIENRASLRRDPIAVENEKWKALQSVKNFLADNPNNITSSVFQG
ncbi:FAD-dependent oxidoreductase [Peribacillus glennii]|uniref:FAD-dependent oxidoreductase n=1 Tax=Peribacillus glennii TaxID=2303991 RepID=A0A372LFB8_9BACI|nr:FAD-dependent oxidoreductase [Peribacillus glennii]